MTWTDHLRMTDSRAAKPAGLHPRAGQHLPLPAVATWLDAANTMLVLVVRGRWDLEGLRERTLELTQRDPEVVDDAFNEIKRRGMLRTA